MATNRRPETFTSSKKVDDLTFIMNCLKTADELPEPNFEEVAKQVGSSYGAVHEKRRFFKLMRKYGLDKKTTRKKKAAHKQATKKKEAGAVPSTQNGSRATSDSETVDDTPRVKDYYDEDGVYVGPTDEQVAMAWTSQDEAAYSYVGAAGRKRSRTGN